MADYSTSNYLAGSQQNLTTTFKTLVNASAATATLRSARVFDVIFGTDGTPADNAIVWQLARQSTLGTGTSATPSPTDSAFAASGMVGTVNMSAEPTTGVSLYTVPVNQRASYRWVASSGKELVIPATNLAGIGLLAKSPGYTSTAGGTIFHTE